MQVGDLVRCDGGWTGIIIRIEASRPNVLVAPIDYEMNVWFHRSEVRIIKTDKKCPTQSK